MYGAEPLFNDLRFNDITPFNDQDFVRRTQNLSRYNDKNQYDRPQEMLNILVCAPSALSSLPFNSFFSLTIYEGFLCWKVYVQVYQITCSKKAYVTFFPV